MNPYLGEVSLVTGGSGGYLGEVSLSPGSISALSVADIAFYSSGKPSALALLIAYLPARQITIPTGYTLSRAKASIAATLISVFTILKNGVSIGILTFAAGSSVGVFAGAGGVIGITDELTVVAPAVADATLSDIRFTLSASR